MRRLLLSLILFHATLTLSADAIPDMKFRRLDTRDGLSNSQVNCVFRDSRGFLWMGTAYGLNRYDGYRFKTFYSNRLDSTSMRDNFTYEIMEAYDGKLWMRQNMSYSVYDPVTESFERDSGRELAKYGITGGIDRIFIDKKKNFWVKLFENGIVCYNPYTKKKIHIKEGYGAGEVKPTYGISSMCDYGDKVLMVTFNGELACLDGEKGRVEWEDLWMRQHGALSNQDYKLFADSQGNFWVPTQEYCFIYIKRDGRWYSQLTDLLHDYQIEGAPDHLQVWDVKVDKRGYVWAATDHDGLFVIDLREGQLKQFLNNKFDESTISENTQKNINIDSRGQVWIGTYKNGVNLYLEGKENLKYLEVGDVNTVTEDRFGNWWIGSNEKGIIVYNPRTNEQLANYTTANSPMLGNIMVGSHAASDGSIWFGSYNGGLTHCVPKGSDGQADIVNYRATNDKQGLAINSVWSITEDHWKRIWIGTLGGGIQMLDPKTNKFRTWDTNNTKLPSNYMTSASWIHKGWLLMGTSYYYCLLNPVTGKLANRIIPEDPHVTVNVSSTVCVMEDSRGLLWHGSSSGFVIYDPKHKTVAFLDMSNGLYSSSACSIVEDHDHVMWLVTDHGVSKVVPSMQKDGSWQFTIRSYNNRDGLQHGTYNQRSAYVTRSGLILVGGQGGLDVINPKGLSNEKSKEMPMFSGLQIFDVDVPVGRELNGRVILDEALNECRSITLRYNDQFTIQLSSDAGIVKNDKRFVYMLEGFNENWVRTSKLNPNITYNSLSAGSYTLHVRMLNDDGTIGDQEATLDITIRPTFWLTDWAMLFYVLIIAVAALLWRRWLMLRYQRYEKVANMRRDIEQETWKSELRQKFMDHQPVADGPASVPIEQIPVEEVLVCERHIYDLVSTLQDICNSFKTDDSEKSCTISFLSTVKELTAEFDLHQIQELFAILFRNSVNFCPETTCVISVGLARTTDSKIQIQVADNGIGIKDEFKPIVFTPMPDGKSIGLERVKAIVVAHGGDIHIEDNPGGGSIFVITLPIAVS